MSSILGMRKALGLRQETQTKEQKSCTEETLNSQIPKRTKAPSLLIGASCQSKLVDFFLSKKTDGEASEPGKRCPFTKLNNLLRKQSHSCPLTLATHLIVGH